MLVMEMRIGNSAVKIYDDHMVGSEKEAKEILRRAAGIAASDMEWEEIDEQGPTTVT